MQDEARARRGHGKTMPGQGETRLDETCLNEPIACVSVVVDSAVDVTESQAEALSVALN